MIDTNNLTKDQKITLEYGKREFQKKLGLNDEELEKFISLPINVKLLLNIEVLFKYRIVAECVESKYCGAGIKVGQKFKFKTIPNLFLPEESDAPMCIKALGPIAEHMHNFWERMLEGLNPNEGMLQYAGCLDLGLEYGGAGHVMFKLYCEEIEPEAEKK